MIPPEVAIGLGFLAIILMMGFLRVQVAVLIGMLTAWLFLPMWALSIEGFPEIGKMTVACAAVFLGAIIFDASRLAAWRPQLPDLLVVSWCVIVPIISSLAGGFGLYEGLGGAFRQTILWGMPYFVGRLYFTSLADVRLLAIGIVIGGLIYAPLCLLEMRLSPQLHRWVYGFHQHQFGQARRGDAWRPTVFMQHGLMVGVWMCSTALLAVWLAVTGSAKRLLQIPFWIFAVTLTLVAILCRSTGATALALLGGAVLLTSLLLRSRIPLLALLVVPPAYVLARTIGGWDAAILSDLSMSLFGEERAGSLLVRLNSETQAWRLMQDSLLLGNGRFNLVGARADESFDAGIIPDGLWLIVLVQNGLFGLGIFFSMLLLPILSILLAVKGRMLRMAEVAPAIGLAVILIVYLADCLLNAMVNPVFMMIAGSLTATAASLRLARRQALAAQRRTASPPTPLPTPLPTLPSTPPVLRSGPPRPQGQ